MQTTAPKDMKNRDDLVQCTYKRESTNFISMKQNKFEA